MQVKQAKKRHVTIKQAKLEKENGQKESGQDSGAECSHSLNKLAS